MFNKNQYIEFRPESQEHRDQIYREYVDKLNQLLDGYEVTAYDPGFVISAYEGYNSGNNIIKTRLNHADTVSFELAHAFLKSHNLHNPSIEYIGHVDK